MLKKVKHIIFTFSLFFCVQILLAQKPGKVKCSSDEYYEMQIKTNPTFASNQKKIEKLTSDLIKRIKNKTGNNKTLDAPLITIPVVVHVLWNHSYDNISDEQINSQITVLNNDYQLNNSDANICPDRFKPLQANCQIEFCLASNDPNGNPTTGIERKHTDRTSFDRFDDDPKFISSDGLDIWDRNQYLNLWVVPEIDGAFGYSQFPGGDAETDGVVIGQNAFGVAGIGTATTLGRTATHEVGHWLNLKHNFDFFCIGLDGVDDTPLQGSSYINQCPSDMGVRSTCSFNGSNGDMYMNYMSYTDDACMNMFTNGQKERMYAVFEPEGPRYSLFFSQGCVSKPDLTILVPSATPIVVSPGDSVTIYFSEENSGHVSAGVNYVNFHLSSDDILTPGFNGDIYLDWFLVAQSLAPLSQTILLSKKIKIPESVSPGTYYIYLAADGPGEIDESNEHNNFASAIITVSDTQSLSQPAYRYWFDNKFMNHILVNTSLSNNNYSLQKDIPTALIQIGLHSFNIQFKDANDRWSSISSSMFYKTNSLTPLGSARYEYWFDDLYNRRITTTINKLNNLVILDYLNTDILVNGLHSLNIRFKPDGKHWSSIISNFFYKSTEIQSGTSQYEYWVDNDTSKTTSNIISTNNFVLLENINANNIANGLHTLNIRFRPDGKKWSSIISSFIYKGNDALTPIDNLAKFVYWYDNNWQNPKTISIIGTQNISWTLNTDAVELSEGRHNLSMMFKDDRGKWSSIISDSFTRGLIATQTCLAGNRQFVSGVVAGNNSIYQWQVDDGNGFANISNNLFYSGATTDTLQLTNTPTSWHGYKYRCVVTNGNNAIVSSVYALKFVMSWNGFQDTNWSNPANWSCNTLPDSNTDVYINANTPNYPIININVTCHSLNLQPGTSIQIGTGFTINVTGQQ